jgi:hypothetical protein
LLDKAEEELPPAPRGSAVETEGKFIEIVYTGNVTLDPNGAATVQLPDWFERKSIGLVRAFILRALAAR